MTVTTSGARVCLSCGTTGGYAHPRNPARPTRIHGLCNLCYHRAVCRGVLQRYPACGAVPIDRLPEHEPWQPAPWGRVPFNAAPEVLPARWLGLPPHAANAPAYLNPTAHARIMEAEQFAAAWLVDHRKEHPSRGVIAA